MSSMYLCLKHLCFRKTTPALAEINSLFGHILNTLHPLKKLSIEFKVAVIINIRVKPFFKVIKCRIKKKIEFFILFQADQR